MTVLPVLAAMSLAAFADKPRAIIAENDVVVRVSWNEAILRRMAGLPLDERQTRMLAVLEKEGRKVEPFPAGSRERENALRAERDCITAQQALSAWDGETLRPILESQKTVINALWPLNPAGAKGPPPAEPPPGARKPPEKDGPKTNAPAASPTEGLFAQAPPEVLSAAEPDSGSKAAPPPSAAGEAAGRAARALKGKGPDAFGPERRDDLPGAPSAAGPEKAGVKSAAARPVPPERGAPESAPSPAPAPSSAATTPPSTAAPGRPDAGLETTGRATSPEPPAPAAALSIIRTAAAPPPAPGATAPAFAPGPEHGPKPQRAPAREPEGAPGDKKKAPPASAAPVELTAEEREAVAEIRKMLAEATGYQGLDAQALSDDAAALASAPPGLLDGIDVAALRDQVDEITRMAGLNGLMLSQQEIVYAAAANLGLSTEQARRVIRALRLTEPPAPRAANPTWWQRLLVRLRRAWRKLDAHLKGRS